MRHFKDNAGRVYDVKISISTFELAKSRLEVDLQDMFFEGGQRVLGNLSLFVNLLYLVCGPQVEKLSIDEFGELILGDPIEGAATALMEAIADSFPSRKREMLLAQLAKAKEMDQAATDQITKAINELTPEKFLKSPTNSAASSRSTRRRSRSASSS